VKLIDLIEDCSRQLDDAGVAFGHGTTNAHDEAAWLVLWRLGLPLDALDEHASRRIKPDELRAVQTLMRRRIDERLPTAYLTGEAWLQGVPFHVDRRTIVPRSLIAEPLADGRLDAWMPAEVAQPHILDLCTGNGSLAVLAALAWPEATLDASDSSADALDVARLNVQRHGLERRVQLMLGEGLSVVRGRRYDLMLCNPPYVNAASMQALPAEFRAEPAVALAGGIDGMDFVRTLIQGAAAVLKEGGALVVEIGHEIDHFDKAFPGLEATWLEAGGSDFGVAALTREALVRYAR
jgi:ribosomal protein L3 glutamine methyltransferase